MSGRREDRAGGSTVAGGGRAVWQLKLPRGILLPALAALLIVWVVAAYGLKLKLIPVLKIERQWSIAIFAGPSPFELTSMPGVRNPVLTAGDVTDASARFVADPFMVLKDSTWYMFFEVLDEETGRGCIGYAASRDGTAWSYGRIVLAEPFHLSYPYVFEWKSEYYMIPESGSDRSIWLYKAVDFPTKWQRICALLKGEDFTDSSILRHDDRWWLFTQTGHFRRGNLDLYYADSLEGPWMRHTGNPIVKENPHVARSAGRIISHAGRLYRYAQDDIPRYGQRVWAIEIEELTTHSYSEKQVRNIPVVDGGDEWWNSRGMHSVDPHQVGNDQWIACVDGHRLYLWFGFNR